MLEGKNAIITGCVKGIGHKIMETFATSGANVWACARKPSDEFEKDTKDLSDRFGVIVKPVYFDLANNEEMKIAIKQIMADKRDVDVLVNNAGITYNALFQMSTSDKINEVMTVNFIAPVMFTQYIVKLMLRKKRGSIINISSTAALDGNSGRSIYGASKAALICATKSLSRELGNYGIRANIIAPGITRTDMLSSMTEEVILQTINETDLKRGGETEDIANVALFLASDMSSYITGQVIRVDGGM